ncbi:MAG: hypothetical protein ACXWNK_19295 [Vulcanimicrobiaceae bacterium]
MAAALLDTFPRLVGVTLFWVIALTVWDIGRHSPMQIPRAIARACSSAARFLAGLLRFTIGLLAAFLALAVLTSTLPPGESAGIFSAYAIGTFLAALAVDVLIGDALRGIVRIKR